MYRIAPAPSDDVHQYAEALIVNADHILVLRRNGKTYEITVEQAVREHANIAGARMFRPANVQFSQAKRRNADVDNRADDTGATDTGADDVSVQRAFALGSDLPWNAVEADALSVCASLLHLPFDLRCTAVAGIISVSGGTVVAVSRSILCAIGLLARSVDARSAQSNATTDGKLSISICSLDHRCAEVSEPAEDDADADADTATDTDIAIGPSWRFTISLVGADDYYGFTVDGNSRFLLGDCTVTHNNDRLCSQCHDRYSAPHSGAR